VRRGGAEGGASVGGRWDRVPAPRRGARRVRAPHTRGPVPQREPEGGGARRTAAWRAQNAGTRARRASMLARRIAAGAIVERAPRRRGWGAARGRGTEAGGARLLVLRCCTRPRLRSSARAPRAPRFRLARARRCMAWLLKWRGGRGTRPGARACRSACMGSANPAFAASRERVGVC